MFSPVVSVTSEPSIETTPRPAQPPPQVEIPPTDPFENGRVVDSVAKEKLVAVEEEILPQVEREVVRVLPSSDEEKLSDVEEQMLPQVEGEVVVLTAEEKADLPLRR